MKEGMQVNPSEAPIPSIQKQMDMQSQILIEQGRLSSPSQLLIEYVVTNGLGYSQSSVINGETRSSRDQVYASMDFKTEHQPKTYLFAMGTNEWAYGRERASREELLKDYHRRLVEWLEGGGLEGKGVCPPELVETVKLAEKRTENIIFGMVEKGLDPDRPTGHLTRKRQLREERGMKPYDVDDLIQALPGLVIDEGLQCE